MASTPATRRSWPERHPVLLPLLPLVHAAWGHGTAGPAAVETLRRWGRKQGWIPREALQTLEPWLDPEDPPAPSEVTRLRDRIRAGLEEGEDLPTSLTELGLRTARRHADEDHWDADARRSLEELEEALGLVGAEAVRALLDAPAPPVRAPAPPPSFDPESLRAFLDADHRELRDELLALLADPRMRIPPGTPPAEYRARVLDAVRLLAERGYGGLAFPRELGGRGDPGASVAAFETLGFGDLSVLVKYGVQFGLFGGSILQLGTERHHRRYLPAVASLELPGCYAMTETAHGSNVRELETVAVWDPETDELVVTTPHPEAAKDWIGNAALHGRLATVFARLEVEGEDHGVHALLVPLRDDEGATLPGIRIEDRGLKEGLNGVDNGRIWFDGVRVPRGNLLDRFGRIDGDGTYRSPIPSEGRRFFTMLATLVAGRVSIASAGVSAAKTALTIAVRWSARRRQFGPAGAEEVPVLDYLVHQRALLPRLATTVGLHFAVRDLQRRYEAHVREEGGDGATVEVRAAGLKAYASRHCVETVRVCREACGGQGYRADNRFGRLLTDTDVFTTFEGANPVLLQLVAKGLLSRFRDEMGDLRLWGMARWLAERTQTTVAERNPVATRRTDPDHLRDPEMHLAAFRYREERLLRSLAQRLKARIDEGMDTFRALNECQDHAVELAEAHVERFILEAFHDGVARAPSPGLSEALAGVAALFALARMEAHRGWYLESGYLEAPKSRAVRAQVNALCGEVREYARFLVDAFGIPDEVLAAPAGR